VSTSYIRKKSRPGWVSSGKKKDVSVLFSVILGKRTAKQKLNSVKREGDCELLPLYRENVQEKGSPPTSKRTSPTRVRRKFVPRGEEGKIRGLAETQPAD